MSFQGKSLNVLMTREHKLFAAIGKIKRMYMNNSPLKTLFPLYSHFYSFLHDISITTVKTQLSMRKSSLFYFIGCPCKNNIVVHCRLKAALWRIQRIQRQKLKRDVPLRCQMLSCFLLLFLSTLTPEVLQFVLLLFRTCCHFNTVCRRHECMALVI